MSGRDEDLIRRLGATVRAAELYAPTHPLVMRTAVGLHTALTPSLVDAPTVIVGFLEDDVVVNDSRLPRGSANMAGLLRDMRDRRVEKIAFARGVEVSDIRALMDELVDPLKTEARHADRVRVGVGERQAIAAVAGEIADGALARKMGPPAKPLGTAGGRRPVRPSRG